MPSGATEKHRVESRERSEKYWKKRGFLPMTSVNSIGFSRKVWVLQEDWAALYGEKSLVMMDDLWKLGLS